MGLGGSVNPPALREEGSKCWAHRVVVHEGCPLNIQLPRADSGAFELCLGGVS